MHILQNPKYNNNVCMYIHTTYIHKNQKFTFSKNTLYAYMNILFPV